MKILIDRQSGVPLYLQVRDALQQLITDGVLGPDDELPASRILARDLGLNRGTVTAAYDDLVSHGFLHRHVGRGTFVAGAQALSAALGPEHPGPRSDGGQLPWKDLFAYDPVRDRDPLAPEIARWGVRSGMISFAGGVPDTALFPAEEFRQALNRAFKEGGASLLQYGTMSGYRPFVDFLRRFLVEKGVGAVPEEILVVNGSQQGIALVARTFLSPGDAIAVEDPSYHGALNLFRTLRTRILPVPVDDDGLDVEAFARLLQRDRPRLLYTMPTFQNPTGVCMSLARRRKLVRLALEHNIPILEDDFDGDLIYEGGSLPPLRGLPEGRDVIYTGTFSKMLFPGIRLGWVVAPPAVIERLAAAKQAADLSTSLLFQAAMVRFAEGHRLERHTEKVRTEYRRRRDAVLLALEHQMPEGVSWTRPAGGFSLLVRLPEGVDSAQLLPQAAQRGVLYTAGRLFSLSGDGRILRLSFGNVAHKDIAEGVKRLADTVREEMKRESRSAGRPSMRALVPPV